VSKNYCTSIVAHCLGCKVKNKGRKKGQILDISIEEASGQTGKLPYHSSFPIQWVAGETDWKAGIKVRNQGTEEQKNPKMEIQS